MQNRFKGKWASSWGFVKRKIPGLNISTDGTIKVGNQRVEKVMIDGDDMFEKRIQN
jgi:hypothetical protein